MDYERILKKIVKILDETNVPYMCVGGIVNNYYGIPRTTFDLDVVISLKKEDSKKVVSRLRTEGFKVCAKEVKEIVRIGNRFVVTLPSSPYRVDFWLAKTIYEKVAFEHRKKKVLFKKQIWIISPEDFILSKLVAGRNQDREDIAGVLRRQRKLDKKYLYHWAKMLDKFKELRQLMRK